MYMHIWDISKFISIFHKSVWWVIPIILPYFKVSFIRGNIKLSRYKSNLYIPFFYRACFICYL